MEKYSYVNTYYLIGCQYADYKYFILPTSGLRPGPYTPPHPRPGGRAPPRASSFRQAPPPAGSSPGLSLVVEKIQRLLQGERLERRPWARTHSCACRRRRDRNARSSSIPTPRSRDGHVGAPSSRLPSSAGLFLTLFSTIGSTGRFSPMITGRAAVDHHRQYYPPAGAGDEPCSGFRAEAGSSRSLQGRALVPGRQHCLAALQVGQAIAGPGPHHAASPRSSGAAGAGRGMSAGHSAPLGQLSENHWARSAPCRGGRLRRRFASFRLPARPGGQRADPQPNRGGRRAQPGPKRSVAGPRSPEGR